jgi:hypothetical protein
MMHPPGLFRRSRGRLVLGVIAAAFIMVAWRSMAIANRWGVYTLSPVRSHYSTSIRPGITRDSVEMVVRGHDHIRYHAVQRETYRTAPTWHGVEEYVFEIRPFRSLRVFVIYENGAVLDVEFDPAYLRHRRIIDSRTADSLIHREH